MTGHLLDFRTTQSRGLRFACWVIFHDFVSSADFFEIIIFKIFFQAYYQSKNSMEPDQARRKVVPDLVQNCLQRSSSQTTLH